MSLKINKTSLLGLVTKLLYSKSNLQIGKNLQCDSIPSIIIEPHATLFIGDNVTLRKDVEIRVHGEAKIRIDDNVRIDRGVRILAANKSTIAIEEGTRIGFYSVFNGGDSITIGKKCLISGFVYLQTSMHRHEKNKFIQEQGYDHSPVSLGDDVWLGVHAVVLPGCHVGPGAIVGSNSVVTKDVESNAIVVGSPAKVINYRE
jgi:acetyltransferase-like isoleucine patch superfamily enzyme